jgi:hypothetical protein
VQQCERLLDIGGHRARPSAAAVPGRLAACAERTHLLVVGIGPTPRTARCGRHNGSDGTMCGCNSHQECETRTGDLGAFCATISYPTCCCRVTPQLGATNLRVSPR